MYTKYLRWNKCLTFQKKNSNLKKKKQQNTRAWKMFWDEKQYPSRIKLELKKNKLKNYILKKTRLKKKYTENFELKKHTVLNNTEAISSMIGTCKRKILVLNVFVSNTHHDMCCCLILYFCWYCDLVCLGCQIHVWIGNWGPRSAKQHKTKYVFLKRDCLQKNNIGHKNLFCLIILFIFRSFSF